VAPNPATPDDKLSGPVGMCEVGKGWTLCPDQSKQTSTTQSVETNVNVPWMNSLAVDTLKLTGAATRASTPWDQWKHRRFPRKRCQWRKQNTRVSHRAHGSAAGVDHSNQPVWEFAHHTIRDVVEACSSSHPDACVGIAWRPGDGIKFNPNGTMVTTPLLTNPGARTYSSQRRCCGKLGENGPGWMPNGSPKGAWMQIDLGNDKSVSGVVTQARGNLGYGSNRVTGFTVTYAKSASPNSRAVVRATHPSPPATPRPRNWTKLGQNARARDGKEH